MNGVFTLSYLLNVVCVAIGFFTFIKLVSNDVYLSRHRILPTIAGIITVYDFYLCIIPFVHSQDTVDFLHLLCDMCALVIMFMMFFYFLFIKTPKNVAVIITIAVTIMIALCVYDFIEYYFGIPKQVDGDMLAIIFVFMSSVIVELKTPSKAYFDRIDIIVGRYMLLAFIVAITGYFLHDYLLGMDAIRSVAFAIDCVIFFWLAMSNRIEDTATILKSTIFDRTERPIALVNSEFYIIDANQKAMELFADGEGISFAFEDGTTESKFVLAENMVKRERNDSEYYACERWYRVHYAPVTEGQEVKGYIISAVDITQEHKEATNAKKETARKSQFLAQMSHELRSPLHAIMGVSDILATKKDISEKNKNLISNIKRASENLLELVNAILDYSKLEAGKFEFTEKEYDLNANLEDMAYSTILNIQSKPIDFNLAITSSYPRYLYGDAIRVREIFQNIFSNAVKYTDKGTIHAEISFEELDDGRVRVDFSVADTGQGMSPEQLEEVFNEYVSSADGVDTEGTGLGLAITRQLVAKLGGSITAESDGISGSVFKGYFYQKQCGGERLMERVLNRRTLLNPNQGFHGLPEKVDYIYPRARVLVADDMRINLEIMQQFLLPWKCEVITVPDGASAIDAVKDNRYDLVFLDQMMMPVSGSEACKKIREFSNVPIVLVTANSEENARHVVAEYGFSDFLAKPILGVKLQEIMDKYMPKDLAEKNDRETVVSVVTRNRQNSSVYQKTLDTFVKEMQPLLLNLPNYRKNDKEMFKVKVHGIGGVSKQIGRETFAEQAQIMEMAAKSETWSYVDAHMDEFLNALCEVVEDATKELTQLAPNGIEEQIEIIDSSNEDVTDILKELLDAFDKYDLNAIEEALEKLDKSEKNQELLALYGTLREAYDNLEYEEGTQILEEYLQLK
ncbi:Signal transduction histidine kinase [Pseudobutyrivibrio sp. C4]|uniref:ATP-binding protein n=1 Tax=Pseudobutyrivibrio sp. C4 TaxID=1520803 RepID=UPI0008D83ED9|nr:ATP-binding protein [Pseudobutyrivibrio sp. C4]SET04067.1 Signal transduction histidine kinase [Pseudobutyrivibrio sp. C4]